MTSSYLPTIKNPKVGVNYVSALLEQSLTYQDASRLTNEIIKRSPKEAKFVVQIAPGVGTMIFTLLQSDRFDGVYTYAKEKNASILANNIEAWGLEDVVNINEKIEYPLLINILPESVVLIDITDQLKLDNLEQMLLRLKKSAMIVIRTIFNIDDTILEGFNVEKSELSNSIVYYLNYIDWNNPTYKKKWSSSLKKYLEAFLPNFINPKSVDKFLTEENMKIWENSRRVMK